MEGLSIFICLLTGHNPDVMRNAPLHERAAMLKEFILLMLVAGASGVAWTCFFGQFEPVYISFPIGAFMFLFIALVDQAIASSDWSLHGILRSPGMRWSRDMWIRIGVRLTITLVLSMATSTGASMAMFGDAIKMQLDHLRRLENQQIVTDYNVEINRFLERMVGNQFRVVKELKEAVTRTTPQYEAALKKQAEIQARLEIAERDMARESTGVDGRFKGKGPRFRAAQDRADAARGELETVNRTISIDGPKADAAQKKLDTAEDALAQAEVPLRPQLEEMEAAKNKELEPKRQDALLSFRAWKSLMRAPDGGDVREFSWLMMGVLMVIELAFFTVRGFFQQPSLYMLELIKSTIETAERKDADHERTVRNIRNWKEPVGLLPNPMLPGLFNDNAQAKDVAD
jgi:Domain of unknown function (DUF4407)